MHFKYINKEQTPPSPRRLNISLSLTKEKRLPNVGKGSISTMHQQGLGGDNKEKRELSRGRRCRWMVAHTSGGNKGGS